MLYTVFNGIRQDSGTQNPSQAYSGTLFLRHQYLFCTGSAPYPSLNALQAYYTRRRLEKS